MVDVFFRCEPILAPPTFFDGLFGTLVNKSRGGGGDWPTAVFFVDMYGHVVIGHVVIATAEAFIFYFLPSLCYQGKTELFVKPVYDYPGHPMWVVCFWSSSSSSYLHQKMLNQQLIIFREIAKHSVVTRSSHVVHFVSPVKAGEKKKVCVAKSCIKLPVPPSQLVSTGLTSVRVILCCCVQGQTNLSEHLIVEQRGGGENTQCLCKSYSYKYCCAFFAFLDTLHTSCCFQYGHSFNKKN